ncbi:MAG: hypothetical protein QF664_06925 [Dehalococcoidia bacterium]|nr:hypothetical protein [Dehalococcoidia bacterium]
MALAIGGLGGGMVAYQARDAEVDRLDRRLEAVTADVGAVMDEVVDSGKEIARLTAEAGDSRVVAERQQTTIRELETTLAETASRLARAETAQGELGLTYVDLLDERDELLASFDMLEAEREDLITELATWSILTRIDSASLKIDPLLFDPASGASLLRAVCTGSMEPSIGCDDTLVAFRPQTQDLAVGDIIIFRAPEPGCVGFSFASTILHRIVVVQRSAEGQIEFRTKGDSVSQVDPCPVPQSHVLFEVLAIISDSRFDQ